MTAFRPVREMRRAGNADGFQHIEGPANRVVGQVFEAEIRRALEESDTAKAERLRLHWRAFKEGRI